ncbi:hypothetical protein V499_02037 [Pseudogymnoascus sp. VKM F-103]|uniref:Mid2 domain-containing protein n=1 Tax=Pseudogymnoascus verrucosus TaxID=342668 RepID=A0A1B8GRG9_9PEZI|nr:uncharacterized protein VE01_03063 [Pseudogymnoascus verrucosus]KFY78884.1 hypothetical protein V499_02037 [Pseudogymnoascus sp. VKM F-103]OBT98429.1 hypothetical protein VE01_03063 [Pseudogymnoascus verrucosus]
MRSLLISLVFLALQYHNLVEASTTARPGQKLMQASSSNSTVGLLAPILGLFKKRQEQVRASTCGFGEGRADHPRTADAGFDCRVDIQKQLWGFCPTTVIAASDCGLAGACVDNHACSTGCGISGDSTVTTFHCTDAGNDFCSTALLTAGPDQTYAYIACANTPKTDHLLASPTSFTTTPTPTKTPTPAEKSTTIPPTTSTTPPPSSSSTTSTSSSDSSDSASSSSSDHITSPPPTGAGISAPTKLVSDESPSSSSSDTAATPPSAPNNVGAIVGGAVGGAALICFVILGVMFLRKRQRDREPKQPSPSIGKPAISGPFHFPDMQTSISRDASMGSTDKFDPYAKYEVYANPYHRMPPPPPRRYTPVELSAYRMSHSPYELGS